MNEKRHKQEVDPSDLTKDSADTKHFLQTSPIGSGTSSDGKAEYEEDHSL